MATQFINSISEAFTVMILFKIHIPAMCFGNFLSVYARNNMKIHVDGHIKKNINPNLRLGI